MAMSSYKDIDGYIAAFPQEVQGLLQTLRETIKDEIPGGEESMSYKMPTFTLGGKYVVYFACWKKHISIYPYTPEMEKVFPETASYKTSGKGTIQFPLDNPLPLPLIRKIVQFRLKENQ